VFLGTPSERHQSVGHVAPSEPSQTAQTGAHLADPPRHIDGYDGLPRVHLRRAIWSSRPRADLVSPHLDQLDGHLVHHGALAHQPVVRIVAEDGRVDKVVRGQQRRVQPACARAVVPELRRKQVGHFHQFQLVLER